MRVFRVIAAVMLGVSLLGEPAMAQMRIMPNYGMPPRGAPLIFLPRKVPPSMAINRALMNNPGARALGLAPNGAGYNVRLKQGNRVFLFPVPGN